MRCHLFINYIRVTMYNNQIKRALSWLKKETSEDDIQNITKVYGGASATILELSGLSETFLVKKATNNTYKIVMTSPDLKKTAIILIKQKF